MAFLPENVEVVPYLTESNRHGTWYLSLRFQLRFKDDHTKTVWDYDVPGEVKALTDVVFEGFIYESGKQFIASSISADAYHPDERKLGSLLKIVTRLNKVLRKWHEASSDFSFPADVYEILAYLKVNSLQHGVPTPSGRLQHAAIKKGDIRNALVTILAEFEAKHGNGKKEVA